MSAERDAAERVMSAVRAAVASCEPRPETAAERAERLRRGAAEVREYNARLLADPTPLCERVPRGDLAQLWADLADDHV
jgi:phage baseplate assembly protein W